MILAPYANEIIWHEKRIIAYNAICY